jgi:hypothetical protein
MFVVWKDELVWGYYDTQAEAVAGIEEERGKEDGVVLRMVNDGAEGDSNGSGRAQA